MSLSKKDYLDIIKTMEISDGSISNDQVSGIIKINIVGMKMQQQEKQISLKSIYDLVVNSIENSNKRFDVLEKDNKEIKKEIKELKLLPTIAKELKQNKIL